MSLCKHEQNLRRYLDVRRLSLNILSCFVLDGPKSKFRNKAHIHLCPLTQLCRVESLERSFSYIRDVWLVFIISCFVEISETNANSVDRDQTPRSAASDLGLHCLPVSLLWDARLKWVKIV